MVWLCMHDLEGPLGSTQRDHFVHLPCAEQVWNLDCGVEVMGERIAYVPKP